MSDLREQVARAIEAVCRPKMTGMFSLPVSTDTMADAALAVAEPIIRARVIEELAQRAENQSRNITTNHKHEEGDYVTFGPLANWLRAQDGTAPHE